MIAMAIACNPKLLIADEPTTALDVTIQAQILDLLLDLQRERGMALILITHDMGVVAETASASSCSTPASRSRRRTSRGLFADAMHPYTAALLARPARARASAGCCRPSRAWCRACWTARAGCLFNPRCALRHRPVPCRSSQPSATARAAGCAATTR